MSDHRYGFNVSFIAVIGALLYTLMGLSPSTDSAPPNNGKKEEVPALGALPDGRACHEPIYGLLCRYYQANEYATARERFIDKQSQVVIATIPDPLDSSAGTDFDAALDALRMAAVSAGYQPDRFYLPWTQKPLKIKSNVKSDVVSPADVSLEVSSEQFVGENGFFPGALLFRRSNDELLLILLVGETATNGINGPAMWQALWYWEDLVGPAMRPALWCQKDFVGPVVWKVFCSWANPVWTNACPAEPQCPDIKQLPPVSIVGPSFSGSASSLRRVLDRWASSQNVPILPGRVISGSVSGDAVQGTLSTSMEDRFRMTFRSLIHPGSDVKEALKSFLCTRGLRRNLLLHEGDTQYGAVPTSSDESGESCWTWTASYPVHVSHVGDAYADLGLHAAREAYTRMSATKPFLPLSRGFVPQPTDVPQAFFPRNTASEVDISMGAMLESFHRLGPDSVTILGSSVHDRLFLASQVRHHLPQAQILLLDEHMLYVHPSHVTDLLGAWVVGTYPRLAFVRTQAGSVLSFRSTEMQGIYNALLAMLSEMHPSRSSDILTHLAGYDGPEGHPDLWLSAVGRSELWPIQPLDKGEKAASFMWKGPVPTPSLSPEGTDRECSNADTLRIPLTSFDILLLVVGILSIYWGSYYWACNGATGADAKTNPRPWPWFRALSWLCHSHHVNGWQRLLPAALFLLVVATHLGGIWIAASAHEAVHGKIVVLALSAPGAVLLFVSAIDLVRRGILQLSGREGTPCGGIVTGLSHSFLVVAGITIARFGWPVEESLKSERALALTSGLSPTFCLYLLAAGVAVGLYAIGRDQRLAHHLPAVLGVTALHKEWHAKARRIEAAVRWRPGWPLYVAVALMLASILLGGRGLVALDREVAWAMSVALPVFTFLVMSLLLHALDVWSALRRFLRALAATSLVKDFHDLPEQRGRTVSLRPSSEPCSAAELEWDIDRVEALVSARVLGLSENQEIARWRAIMVETAARSWWTYSYESPVQQALSGIAGCLVGKGRAFASMTKPERELIVSQITRFIALLVSIMKNSIGAALASALLLLLAVASYPIHPHPPLMRWALALVSAVVVVCFLLVMMMERNELLSRIANRSKGKVDLDGQFFAQIGAYVIVPVVAVLATQFPALSQWLFTFLQSTGR